MSVPFQNNTNFNIGPANRIQPVIPIGLSEDWNLIVRWITHRDFAADSYPEGYRFLWVGDMVPSFFLSPSKPGALI
jgi:hypothetical protein